MQLDVEIVNQKFYIIFGSYGILQARILECVAMEIPPPGDLPEPGIKLMSLKSPALAGEFCITSAT